MKQTHRTFNIYWIQRLLITSIFILASTLLYAQCYVSPTKYDYSTLAKSITKNAKSKLEKNRAIFNWICENIAYDTSYTIYTADECYEQKKGVCQAYSELYYRLCEAVGIKCIIISGKTKDYTGTIDEKGHAWIYAELEKGSILVDPTWGAGYTNNNTFTFHKKDFWFQIDPYWLIFTHFPNDEQFQFLKKTIDFQTFSQLPPLNPSCQYLGFKAQDIFNKIGKKKITSLPHIYSFDKEEALILNKTPLQETLNPATKYKFEIENPNNLEFAIIVNNTWYHSNQWKKKGNKYTLELLPAEGGELKISIKGKDMSSYNTLIKYKLTKPTTREQKYINEKRPPIKKSVDFSRIKILKSPKQMNLNPATTYKFEVENPTHQDFAIITNKTWYYSSQWQKKGSKYWIDFMPADEGELKISIKDPKDNLYYPLVIYNVLKPTQQELEFIENHRPPIFHEVTNNNLKLINIPKYRKLNPATTYRFEVENPIHQDFVIITDKTWYYSSQWQKEGSKYWIDLIPADEGELKISIKDPKDNLYYPLVKYNVLKPTQQELEFIENHRPPIFYDVTNNNLKLINIPKYRKLNPATTYRFEVENPTHQDFAIITNETWYYSSQWQKEGSKYWIDIMPADEGELKISIKNQTDTRYSTLVEYTVLAPTQQELEFIENHRPPIFYDVTNNNLKLINIPKYRKLNPATTYRFEVENPTHQDFAIITNETWYYSSQWQKEGSKYWIDIIPADEGELKISIKDPKDNLYYTLVKYNVLKPTQQELEFIENHRPPIFYDVTNNNLKLINIPKYRKLNPATTYRFEVENPTHQDFAIITNETWYYSSQWQKEGSKYWIDIIPADEGELKISIKNQTDTRYSTLVKYTVLAPTQQELEFIENHRPPIFYDVTNNNLKLINIPKYRKLNPATTYRFEVENPTHQDFVIITDKTWYYSSQWQKEGSKYWIDLMPADEGELKISIKNQTNTRYSTLVEYTVLAPTQQELEFIENHRPPIFYDVTNNNLKLINTPKYRKLNPATTYRFEVENPTHQDFAIIINKTWYYSSQWQKEGSKYWIDIIPAEGGTLKLSVQNSGLYYTFVEYNITIPTVQEQQKIKQKKYQELKQPTKY